MKIAVLSNVNMDMLISSLKKSYDVFDVEGYGNWAGYAVSKDEKLSAFNPKYVFCVFDGSDLIKNCRSAGEVDKELDLTAGLVNLLAANYPGSIIAVSDIDVRDKRIKAGKSPDLSRYAEKSWSERLSEAAAGSDRICVFDLKGIVEQYGRSSVYADNMWYMGSIPFSLKSIQFFAAEIDLLISRNENPRKKVLVLDLDNTIWGGVCGEDGPNGITLGETGIGRAYQDAQRKIKEIGETGVLLAVVSKNNPEDVKAVFDSNRFMILSEKDFTKIKCSWNSKTENIESLAIELNLGPDSFVFLDDNPVERAEVTGNIPGIIAPEFPKDVSKLPALLNEIYKKYFWINRLLAEDEAKKEQYEQESRRAEIRSSAASLEDYIKSLDIEIEMSKDPVTHEERIVQLINKTNQFNVLSRRFDTLEYDKYVKENGLVYSANVSDRYGDSGLVVILMARIEGRNAYIDNFLMSCRVMGRQIEDAFMQAVKDDLASRGVKKLFAEYKRTSKNKPVENLFEKLSFKLTGETDGEKEYYIDLPNDARPLLKVKWS